MVDEPVRDHVPIADPPQARRLNEDAHDSPAENRLDP